MAKNNKKIFSNFMSHLIAQLIIVSKTEVISITFSFFHNNFYDDDYLFEKV